MKENLTTAFLILLTAAATAQSTVTIKGKFSGDNQGKQKVYIYGTGVKQDSAVMKDGAFQFVLPFEGPFMPLFYTEYDREVKHMYSPYPVLVDRPGVVTLSDGDITKGMASFRVSGLKSAKEFDEVQQRQKKMYNEISATLQKKYGDQWYRTDNPKGEAINREREQLTGTLLSALLEDFIKKHPDSYASGLALSGARSSLEASRLEKLYGLLSAKGKQTKEARNVADYLAGLKSSAIGSTVKDFTLPDPTGNDFSFSQLKGKYVLIDFWASWCGPCKQSFPHMKEVYQKYKGDRFEIYSISIDKDKDAWLKGLKEQQLPWIQTLDTKNISQSGFAVTGVPTTYLIDPQGKILMKEVGFDPGGNSPLEKKLTELFGAGKTAGTANAKPVSSLPFSIKGQIDDIKEPARVILQYSHKGKRVSDTTALVRGAFSFKGGIDKPLKGLLYILKDSDNPRMGMAIGYGGEIIGRDGIALYLDKGEMAINGATLKTATVTGSPSHTDYEALQRALQPFYDEQAAIGKKMGALTPEQRKGPEYDRLMGELQASFKSMTPVRNAFVRSHTNSYVSWDIVAGKSIIDDPASQKELLYSFGKKFLESPSGKDAIERLEAAFKTAIGQPAPAFTQNDTEGHPVSLASLKGKYVLIDFWASWCGPCRAENPNVKRAYEKFKDKNFEILAVSLDDKKDAWLKAIADDGLPWVHVSDLKGWKNEVAALYNVRAVPQNWLLDPNGVIIAKNMRGDELQAKLEELIK